MFTLSGTGQITPEYEGQFWLLQYKQKKLENFKEEQ